MQARAQRSDAGCEKSIEAYRKQKEFRKRWTSEGNAAGASGAAL